MEIKYGRICGKVAVMDDKVFIQDMIKGTVIEADCPDDWADLIADASANEINLCFYGPIAYHESMPRSMNVKSVSRSDKPNPVYPIEYIKIPVPDGWNRDAWVQEIKKAIQDRRDSRGYSSEIQRNITDAVNIIK